MLQVFHMNVAKVDQMLHMLNETHLLQPYVAPAGTLPSGQTVLTCVRATRETSGQRELAWARKKEQSGNVARANGLACAGVRSNVRALASP
jgi:hypothetical protein